MGEGLVGVEGGFERRDDDEGGAAGFGGGQDVFGNGSALLEVGVDEGVEAEGEIELPTGEGFRAGEVFFEEGDVAVGGGDAFLGGFEEGGGEVDGEDGFEVRDEEREGGAGAAAEVGGGRAFSGGALDFFSEDAVGVVLGYFEDEIGEVFGEGVPGLVVHGLGFQRSDVRHRLNGGEGDR